MKLGLIGIGGAGGRVVESLLQYEDGSRGEFIADAVAIHTATADLKRLERVPVDNRVPIGQTQVKGRGTGADSELGAEIATADIAEIRGTIDDVPVGDLDAFLVVAGLGGGTGGGGAPVVARELGESYAEPVYGLGVLPGADEGRVYALNAARSVRTLVRETDALVLVDNDGWQPRDESAGAGYRRVNADVARRLGVLFSAGETDGHGTVPESVVDASEISNTFGTDGVVTVGYAASRIESPESGFLSRISGSEPEEIDTGNQITSTVRMATLGRLSLACDITSAERALVVVAGPPEHLDRNGIERSRTWLEEATGTMEVRGGDYPVPDSSYVAAVVVLAGVSDVPRLAELQRTAVKTQRSMEEAADESERNPTDCTPSGDNDIEPLF
ncbi:tubulin/FtsZ family protein [Halorientalis salina]|uniref:tubulin/FtsZ family protein n=1 Tax=Halorientalis salina TaxID=2932266 RepID=UPI0010AD5D28|nr:tubulin/FtsZ family protein [Halorientalis salina]